MSRAPQQPVVIVADNLQMGGAHTYAVQLANSLVTRGIPVTLAFGGCHEAPLAARLSGGVCQLPLPLRRTDHPGLTTKWRHVPNTWSAARVLAQHLRGLPGAVVHTLFAASAVPAWLAARAAHVPVVATPMATWVSTEPLARIVFRSRPLQRLVTRYVALSDYSRRDFARGAGIKPERVETVRLGVDVRRFVPPALSRTELGAVLGRSSDLACVRLWCGVTARLDAAKHVDLAVRAVSACPPEAGVHLAIVGDGPLRDQLERLVTELGAADRVHFLGRHLDVRPFVQAFDVYLQTTRGPNLGLAALEALASGVPILIATRDAEEVLMAEDTLLGRGGTWAEATPAALSASLIALAKQTPAERATARQAARHLAETAYDWDRHVDGLLDIYGRIRKA